MIGYHVYCDGGGEIPAVYGGPIYTGYDTGYNYYVDYHIGEFPC